MVSLAERRRAAAHLEEGFGVSERRACRVLHLCRSSKRRQPGKVETLALEAEQETLELDKEPDKEAEVECHVYSYIVSYAAFHDSFDIRYDVQTRTLTIGPKQD